jgi:hypothetical protein
MFSKKSDDGLISRNMVPILPGLICCVSLILMCHLKVVVVVVVVAEVNNVNRSVMIARGIVWKYLYGGADKSLARPGMKQATATEDFEFHVSYL